MKRKLLFFAFAALMGWFTRDGIRAQTPLPSPLGAAADATTGTVTSVSGIPSEINVATGTTTPVISVAAEILNDTIAACSPSGGSDTYACSTPVAIPYVTNGRYRFKADVANVGAATINFNAQGAKTIVKVAGGITTALADNDIRAGQVVDLVYDGTNMQMQSTLGNASAGALPAGSVNCVQLTDGVSAFLSGCLADNTKPALIGPPLSAAGSDVVGVGGAIFNQIDTVPGDFAYGFSFVAETTQVDAGVTGGFLIGILNAGAGTGVGTSYGGESVLVVAGPSNYTGTGAGALASMDAQINFHGSGTIAEIYDYQSDANPGLGGSTRAIGILGSYHALNPCGVLDMVTATNCVGMKIDDVSGGSSTNRALWTGLGLNQLGDQLYLARDMALPFLQTKTTASASAPGAGLADLRWVAGTNAGTCKLVANAGTSATEIAIIDNVGGGC